MAFGTAPTLLAEGQRPSSSAASTARFLPASLCRRPGIAEELCICAPLCLFCECNANVKSLSVAVARERGEREMSTVMRDIARHRFAALTLSASNLNLNYSATSNIECFGSTFVDCFQLVCCWRLGGSERGDYMRQTPRSKSHTALFFALSLLLIHLPQIFGRDFSSSPLSKTRSNGMK